MSRPEEKTDAIVSPSEGAELSRVLEGWIARGESEKVAGGLLRLLQLIARTGSHQGFPWVSVRKLVAARLDNVMTELIAMSSRPADLDGESYDLRHKRIHTLLSQWPRAPFTLQRQCELLTDHKRFYRTATKYFLAFSKLVCGISARAEEEEDEGARTPSPGFFGYGGSMMDTAEERAAAAAAGGTASTTTTAPTTSSSSSPASDAKAPVSTTATPTATATTSPILFPATPPADLLAPASTSLLPPFSSLFPAGGVPRDTFDLLVHPIAASSITPYVVDSSASSLLLPALSTPALVTSPAAPSPFDHAAAPPPAFSSLADLNHGSASVSSSSSASSLSSESGTLPPFSAVEAGLFSSSTSSGSSSGLTGGVSSIGGATISASVGLSLSPHVAHTRFPSESPVLFAESHDSPFADLQPPSSAPTPPAPHPATDPPPFPSLFPPVEAKAMDVTE